MNDELCSFCGDPATHAYVPYHVVDICALDEDGMSIEPGTTHTKRRDDDNIMNVCPDCLEVGSYDYREGWQL